MGLVISFTYLVSLDVFQQSSSLAFKLYLCSLYIHTHTLNKPFALMCMHECTDFNFIMLYYVLR